MLLLIPRKLPYCVKCETVLLIADKLTEERKEKNEQKLSHFVLSQVLNEVRERLEEFKKEREERKTRKEKEAIQGEQI